MYQYKATVVRVVDGDTVYLDIDLGFRIRMTIDVRLYGLDAPELRGPSRAAGLKAKAYVENALPVGAMVIVKTYKAEKYGSYLAEVWYLPGATEREQIIAQGRHLNQELLDAGFAVPYLVK